MTNAIQHSSRNQLGNCKNSFQTDAKRVLCVCSAGLLRSPTLANVLHEKFGFNTRACGTGIEFALIPISAVLLTWADEIVFVSANNLWDVQTDQGFIKYAEGKVIRVLNVPDEFSWNDKELREMLLADYEKSEHVYTVREGKLES